MQPSPGAPERHTSHDGARRMAVIAAVLAGIAFGALLSSGASPGVLALVAMAGLGAMVLAFTTRPFTTRPFTTPPFTTSPWTALSQPAPAAGQTVSAPLALDQPGLEAVIDAAPTPLVLLDRALQVRLFNRAALDLLPNLSGQRAIVDVIRVPEVIEAVRAVAATRETRTAAYQERVPVERSVELSVAPVPDGRGFLLLGLADVSQARQLEAMRVTFVANASHELRTPLASLSGFIDTLLGPARNDAAARERFLGIMRAQADRMSRLIDDLLSLSRIELNAHRQPREPVDLAAIVGHVADTLAPLAADRGVRIELEGLEGPLTVAGDRDELIRVFENLIENAIKYGGGRVLVSGETGGSDQRADQQSGQQSGQQAGQQSGSLAGEVAVTVRDFGPGIPAEHLPRLTERFYRVDVAQSRQRGGTGLGLAIVKHIVARHRGRLVIGSVVGEGAAFTVRLRGVDA